MNGGDQKRPAGRIALWALSDRYALRLTLGRGALGAQTLSLALWDGDTGRAVRIAGAARPFGDSKPPALPQGTDALRIQAGNCAALLERTGGGLRGFRDGGLCPARAGRDRRGHEPGRGGKAPGRCGL